jgi:hypothetical protein
MHSGGVKAVESAISRLIFVVGIVAELAARSLPREGRSNATKAQLEGCYKRYERSWTYLETAPPRRKNPHLRKLVTVAGWIKTTIIGYQNVLFRVQEGLANIDRRNGHHFTWIEHPAGQSVFA